MLGRLRSFYRDLRNHALEFDPSIPSEPGFAIDGGVALGERRAGDRNLLIRALLHEPGSGETGRHASGSEMS